MHTLRKIACFLVCLICCSYHSLLFAKGPLTLSLEEAILLSVRSNPNIQVSQLNYVSQKFSEWIQEWQFRPHYTLSASAMASRNRNNGDPFISSQTWNMFEAGTTLQTPIGTQISVAATNPQTSEYNPGISAEIVQPLMRGFGKAVVEAALNNAKDDLVIAQLNIENVLKATVTEVIRAYLNVVAAQQQINIDQKAFERAQLSVKQTKLFIKAGHIAGNEIITVQADAARAQSQLENDKNNLLQARYALLAAIGLDPNTEVTLTNVDLNNLIHKINLPNLEHTKQEVLVNDISYQTAQITLHGSTKRNLLVAEDNTRWKLDLQAEANTGGGTGSGPNSGVNSLFNGANQGQSISLTLQIPIDDQPSKQALLNAKIALQTAEIELRKQKWGLETNAINNWNSVGSAERALQFALDAEKLQEKTYQVSYQKYLHGLIDSLELQSAQLQLVQSQQNLLNARLSYLNALVNLDYLTGHTLKTWNVKVRLG